MEILRENEDFITTCVSSKEILEWLLEKELLSTFDYGRIIIVGEASLEALPGNKGMFDELLTVLETYKDDRESVYSIFDYIREKHPAVAVCIPAIRNVERMKVAIGPDTMLTVALFGDQIGYDIRKVKVCFIFSLYFMQWRKLQGRESFLQPPYICHRCPASFSLPPLLNIKFLLTVYDTCFGRGGSRISAGWGRPHSAALEIVFRDFQSEKLQKQKKLFSSSCGWRGRWSTLRLFP